MFKALGIVEFVSISKGMQAADTMMKVSTVEVISVKHICPGKFMIILTGDVEDINEAVKSLEDFGEKSMVGTYVLANAHEDLISAIGKRVLCKDFDALGIMEFSTVTAGIASLDMALKSASVKLVKVVLGNGIGGKCYFVITGTVSSIEESLNAAEKVTMGKKLIHKAVIPSPNKMLLNSLF